MENDEIINNLSEEIERVTRQYIKKPKRGRPRIIKPWKRKRPVGRPRKRVPHNKIKRPVGRPKKIKKEKPKKIKKPKPIIIPNKRGRPRVSLPYADAKALVRSEGITTKKDYLFWRRHTLIRQMPLRPDRAYKNDNFSWNDFLGTNNKFLYFKHKRFLPYNEARIFAHKLGLKTSIDWLYYASKSGKRPDNIPSNPSIYYSKKKEWTGWKDFLGRDLFTAQETLVQAVRCILYVIKVAYAPHNVFKIHSTIESIDKLKQLQSEDKIRIVKIYQLDSITEDWKSKVHTFLSPYAHGDEHDYAINDVGGLLSELGYSYSLISS